MGNLIFNTLMKSLAIFDPPRVLVPGEGLVPGPHYLAGADPSSANVQSGPSPQPAQTPKQDLTMQTGGPSGPLAEDPHTTHDGPAMQSTSTANDPHNTNGGTAVAGKPSNKPYQQNGQGFQDTPNDPSTSNPPAPANGNNPGASAGSGSEKPNQDLDIDSSSIKSLNDGPPRGEKSSHEPGPSIGDMIMQDFGRKPPSDERP